MKTHIFPTLVFFLGLFSCASTTDRNDDAATLLTQDIWTSYHLFEDIDLDGSFVEYTDSCETDDRWDFKSAGIIEVSEGTMICDPDYPSGIITINWELTNDDTELNLISGIFKERYKILSLTENEMILGKIEENSPNETYFKVQLNR